MEMEMEMEMRAREEIKEGEDITPPLPPLSFSLHDSFLVTHCSSCFSPLPSAPFPPVLPSTSTSSVTTLSYCSRLCSSLDSPLHLSSSEFLLLQSHPASSSSHTSDLRAALRFLSLLHSSPSTSPPPRLSALLSNRDKVMSSEDPDVVSKIREGAREIAKAARGTSPPHDAVSLEEAEAALCLVMTNAVEVQDKSGRVLGIAVYDKHFSWINHSCSPNACYRFLLSQPHTVSFPDQEPEMRIVPHVSTVAETPVKGDNGSCSNNELTLAQVGERYYGPRIIVRSIKPISKGEEVTVAYTDLLQPKAMRQSELWSKYQFVCCCRRCTASPPTYVDQVLQEIFVCNQEYLSLSSDENVQRDDANQKLTDYMDEVLTQYLSVGDPEACCKKLEKMLTHGLQGEQLETEAGKLQLNCRFHRLHHLALNAYTTLASAYKICSIDLSSLYSDIDGRHWEAFNMSRISAAYSLLLAGGTDHLFQSESSLIASAANFWASAGESLVTLARSSTWNLFVKPGLSASKFSVEKHKCTKCSLVDRFEVNSGLSQAQNVVFEDVSSDFLDCISDRTQNVWSFLIHGCQPLQIIKDPVNFSWIGKFSHPLDAQAHSNRAEGGSCWETDKSNSRREAKGYSDEIRMNIFIVGVHCLLYGSYLSNICYGPYSHLAYHIQNVLYNEEERLIH